MNICCERVAEPCSRAINQQPSSSRSRHRLGAAAGDTALLSHDHVVRDELAPSSSKRSHPKDIIAKRRTGEDSIRDHASIGLCAHRRDIVRVVRTREGHKLTPRCIEQWMARRAHAAVQRGVSWCYKLCRYKRYIGESQ